MPKNCGRNVRSANKRRTGCKNDASADSPYRFYTKTSFRHTLQSSPHLKKRKKEQSVSFWTAVNMEKERKRGGSVHPASRAWWTCLKKGEYEKKKKKWRVYFFFVIGENIILRTQRKAHRTHAKKEKSFVLSWIEIHHHHDRILMRDDLLCRKAI